jgi:hypothetical protein
MKIRFDFDLDEVLNIQHKTCHVSRLPLNLPTPGITPYSIANAFGGEAIPELIFRFWIVRKKVDRFKACISAANVSRSRNSMILCPQPVLSISRARLKMQDL